VLKEIANSWIPAFAGMTRNGGLCYRAKVIPIAHGFIRGKKVSRHEVQQPFQRFSERAIRIFNRRGRKETAKDAKNPSLRKTTSYEIFSLSPPLLVPLSQVSRNLEWGYSRLHRDVGGVSRPRKDHRREMLRAKRNYKFLDSRFRGNDVR